MSEISSGKSSDNQVNGDLENLKSSQKTENIDTIVAKTPADQKAPESKKKTYAAILDEMKNCQYEYVTVENGDKLRRDYKDGLYLKSEFGTEEYKFLRNKNNNKVVLGYRSNA